MLDVQFLAFWLLNTESKARRKVERIVIVEFRRFQQPARRLSSSLEDRRSSTPPLASFLAHTREAGCRHPLRATGPLIDRVFHPRFPANNPSAVRCRLCAASRSTSRVHAPLEEEFYFVVGLARLEVKVVFSLSSKKRVENFYSSSLMDNGCDSNDAIRGNFFFLQERERGRLDVRGIQGWREKN